MTELKLMNQIYRIFSLLGKSSNFLRFKLESLNQMNGTNNIIASTTTII